MPQNQQIMIDHNPMQHFQKWFYEADELYKELEPNAMSLTTIGVDNYPKSRMVLLKKYTWEGFIFFTNYESDKGLAITLNPEVYLLFNWTNSGRMIQVSGKAFKISKALSSNYFDLRPRDSKLGAWVSQQSQVIASRRVLENDFLKYENQFKNKEVPKPEFWGGYLIKPTEFHFHQTQDQEFRCQESYYLKEDYSWSKDTQIRLKTY
ncbi:MAG: pyridoxamine 5'-phosphate oxidase [Dokdonia sp.]|jgi:pyridoxamine 5'-phosphate oxidase